MNPTFDRLYHTLGNATLGLLFGALAFYGITLFCAVLGFARVSASLGGVAASLSYAFVILLVLFLVASIVAAAIR